MASQSNAQRSRRETLLKRINELAQKAIFGSLAETYRTCGNPGCRCHREGTKHGPHLSISYRSEGRTVGYHVPVAARDHVRAGVEAWHLLQECLRELADMNTECILAEAKEGAGQ